VRPLECQSNPKRQPRAWNQWGSESRSRTPRVPKESANAQRMASDKATILRKSHLGACPQWRGRSAVPTRFIT